MEIFAGKPSSETLEYLLKRRSVKVDDLCEPGPNSEQLAQVLAAATRVPDHGKVCPFYFIVFEGDARAQAGEILMNQFIKNNPQATDDKIEKERTRFLRAPVVVALVMRARKSKNPLWEQILSVGAAAQNFILAANAMGFGAQWLTEWYAYDADVRAALGLDEADMIAGFIYVGSVAAQPEERERPDLVEIVNYWSPDGALKKGDVYHKDKFDYPEAGFDFSRLKG